MQDVIELIVKNIVTKPDEVTVETSQEEDREVYTITVAPDDMGRVIGKNGKIIRAIRKIAHVIAIRQDKRYSVRVAEVGEEGDDNPDNGNEDDQTESHIPEPQTQEVTIMDSSQVETDENEAQADIKESTDLIADALTVEEE